MSARLRMRRALGPEPAPTGWPAREPGPADRAALAELMLAAYAGTVDADGGETIVEALAEIDRTFAGDYGPYLGPCSCLVEADGRVAGACLITLWQDTPLVAYVMVAPEHQGRGLGAFLMRHSAAALFAQGYARLELFVTDGNAPAQRLYRRLGYADLPS